MALLSKSDLESLKSVCVAQKTIIESATYKIDDLEYAANIKDLLENILENIDELLKRTT